MNKENNMELKSEYVEVEVLGYGLPLYNAIGSSGDKVIYEGIEYDSTMINAWEVLTGSSTIQIGGQCCNQHCTSSHPDDLERMLSYHSLHRLCSPMRNFI